MSSRISLPRVVVADANVLLSALIGGRAGLVIAAPRGPSCVAAEAVWEEVAEHLPALATRRSLDASVLLAALSVMPVDWHPESVYVSRRTEAERLIAHRDPEDWPTVALALALSLPIWSQDKDLCVTDLPVFTTGELLDAL